MESSTTTSASLSRAHTSESRPWFRLSRRAFVIALATVAVIFSVVIVLYIKIWPFTRDSVLKDLSEASGGEVTVQSFRPTYFPPGCILERLEFRNGPDRFKLITMDKLIIEAGYIGILGRHVGRITAVAAHITVPAFCRNTTFNTQNYTTIVDEIVANGSSVVFESKDPKK